jgi:hypothetical protein
MRTTQSTMGEYIIPAISEYSIIIFFLIFPERKKY